MKSFISAILKKTNSRFAFWFLGIFFTLLIVVFYVISEQAPLIEDYKIEGIGLGDSLLDFMSDEKIKNEIESNKHRYNHLKEENKFVEIYFFDGLKIYEAMSFFIKPNENKYIIYGIYGDFVINDMDQCHQKQDEISKEFSTMYKNAEQTSGTKKHSADSTGQSEFRYNNFAFDSGDEVLVQCYKFAGDLANDQDGLSISIISDELVEWFINSKN